MKDLTIRINDDHIKRIARRFGIEFNEIVDTIDSSHGEGDVRINCILDNKYVLKINTEAAITEARLAEIAGLIERYSAIGVYCPMLQRTVDGSYSTYQEIDGHKYICYAEEFANYELGNNDIKRAEIIEHLGILAARYSDV
ncbi:MAG: hypothetical protein J1E60_01960 [Christensenellaceae bacterium]|nr:hypothetical protein [Christensenellaceae bacterium]